MSNLEDYNTKLEVIKAIPDDQIKIPGPVPVGIYIQEAQDLYINRGAFFLPHFFDE